MWKAILSSVSVALGWAGTLAYYLERIIDRLLTYFGVFGLPEDLQSARALFGMMPNFTIPDFWGGALTASVFFLTLLWWFRPHIFRDGAQIYIKPVEEVDPHVKDMSDLLALIDFDPPGPSGPSIRAERMQRIMDRYPQWFQDKTYPDMTPRDIAISVLQIAEKETGKDIPALTDLLHREKGRDD